MSSFGPRAVICYICGRKYGTSSIKIHEPQCLKKWHIENQELPKNLRRRPPVRPQGYGEFTNDQGLGGQINAMNEASYETSKQQLLPCENCGRTFFPERLPVHQRSCRPGNVAKPSRDNLGTAGISRYGLENNFQEQPREPIKPKIIVCYICGREFGTASIPIHEPQCLKKWKIENNTLPKHMRRPIPSKPDVLPSLTGSDNNQECRNMLAYESAKQQLVPCPNCKRTFQPDRLSVHMRSCKRKLSQTTSQNTLLDRFGFADTNRKSPTFEPRQPLTPPRRLGTKTNHYKKQTDNEQFNNKFGSETKYFSHHKNTLGLHKSTSNSCRTPPNVFTSNGKSRKDSNSYTNAPNSFSNTRPGSNTSDTSNSNEIRRNSNSVRLKPLSNKVTTTHIGKSNFENAKSIGTNMYGSSYSGITPSGSNGGERSSETRRNVRARRREPSRKTSGLRMKQSGFKDSTVDFTSPGGLGTSAMNNPEASQSSGSSNLTPCFKCGRTFASDRIEKHQSICSNIKQRKVFNSSKKRVEGTEAASYNRGGKRSTKHEMPKPKSNWRKNHEEFVRAIRDAKKVQQYVKKGGNLSDLPPPPPNENPDYVYCKHCTRRFAPETAARHIPKCATTMNRPAPPKQRAIPLGGARNRGGGRASGSRGGNGSRTRLYR